MLQPSDPAPGTFKKGARTGREEIERIELARHLRNEGRRAEPAVDDDQPEPEEP